MGNSYGRFSEELPTETDAPGEEKPVPAQVPDEVAEMPTSQHPQLNLSTQPHEQLTEEDLKKKVKQTS